MRPPGRNRPRAIRKQTTASRRPQAIRRRPVLGTAVIRRRPLQAIRRRPQWAIRAQTPSRPSACRRPPGHPHADDLQAIRMQTTDTCERRCMNVHGLRGVSTPRSPSDAHTEYLRVQIGSLCQANHLPGGSFLGGLGRHLHQLTPLKRDAGVHSESAECIAFHTPYVMGSAPYVVRNHVAVAIGTVVVRCAACSELRIVHVSVLCGVRAIVRNVLQVVHVSMP